MTTLYVKAVDVNSWSRTAWDDTGTTDYVVGDRVTTTVGDGGTYDALLKTYVCIANNNSTTDPGSDSGNWVRAGESKEYPYHAPGGKLDTNQILGEVFLDNAATRYKSTTNPQASFWWHAQDYTANNAESANIVFLNGSYSCKPSNGQSIATERLNFEAESHLKVTIDLGDNPQGGQGFFRYNDNVVSTMKDIKFLVAGSKVLFQADTCISFVNCTITDGGPDGDYDPAGLPFGSYGSFSEFKNCLIHLPSASTQIAGFSSLSDGLHPVTGEKMLWENTTFALQWGSSNNYDAWFYNNNYVKVRNCIFYILGLNYTGGSPRIATAGLDVENSIFYAEATSQYWGGSDNDGLIDRNPLFIDGVNGDFRLRPGSPLIGGGASSKFPADAVWMQSGSGTGTGTESDPYYFDQFTDALSAASSSTSKKVVLKDGTYTFGNSHCADSNINSVTFTAENLHGATISDGASRKAIAQELDNTLNIENLTLEADDHFINASQSQGKLSLVAKGCKLELAKYIYFDNCDISGCIIIGSTWMYLINGDSTGNFLVRNCTIIGTAAPVLHTLVDCKNSILYVPSASTNTPGGITTDCMSYNCAAQDGCIDADPLFVDSTNGNYQLRPSSPGVGGITPEDSNVYYLQPGNTYNGDGSQKDASAMTSDGDAGPFNEFKEIVAAGVPYGSTIIILNGTYDWTSSFGKSTSTDVSENTWHDYTCAGYNYVAETMHEVIFDAKLNPDNVFIYKPYGGTAGSGVFLDLDTTFTGIQFNNMIGNDSVTRNTIGSVADSAGQGSCTFNSCKFLGHINTATNSSYPWTGGGKDIYASTMHWKNCEIQIAYYYAGGLLCGEENFANDSYHGAWSWENCTFYIPTGLTTFNGTNAANGTYVSPALIFGTSNSQSQRVFRNNIIEIPNGTAEIGANNSGKLPDIKNNCFNGVDPVYSFNDHSAILNSKDNLFGVDPVFVDSSNGNFALRPSSPLIGRG